MTDRTRDEHGWRVYDDASSEVELHELLHSLVSMLKPDLVVETGCHKGYGTRALALGLLANGRGRLVTCDVDGVSCIDTSERLRAVPALRSALGAGVIEIVQCRGSDLADLPDADFVFIDSDYRDREGELRRMKPGAFALVHDTEISYDSRVPPLKHLVRTLGGLLFPTHRGAGLLQIPESWPQ